MAYRGSSKFHHIKEFRTSTSFNYSVTITKEAAHQFEGKTFYEVLISDGILLLKSGCDMVEKNKKILEGLKL